MFKAVLCRSLVKTNLPLCVPLVKGTGAADCANELVGPGAAAPMSWALSLIARGKAKQRRRSPNFDFLLYIFFAFYNGSLGKSQTDSRPSAGAVRRLKRELELSAELRSFEQIDDLAARLNAAPADSGVILWIRGFYSLGVVSIGFPSSSTMTTLVPCAALQSA